MPEVLNSVLRALRLARMERCLRRAVLDADAIGAMQMLERLKPAVEELEPLIKRESERSVKFKPSSASEV